LKVKPKISKPKLPKLLKEADRVFSLYIRNRDKRCVCCNATERLQCGHLIKRGRRSIRFHEKNCNCQCASCNVKHNYYPEFYTNWFIKKYGLCEYEALINQSKEVKKFTVSELQEIIKKYENK